MPMRLKFWGVRGNLATPHSPDRLEVRFRELLYDFFKRGYRTRDDVEGFASTVPAWKRGGYGGNTTCVEVMTDNKSILIDAGTGLVRLGRQLMSGECGQGQGEVHILMTHFHWDHIMGLTGFAPLFVQGNRIHVYSVQPEAEVAVRTLFQKPFFPVPFESLPAEMVFYQLEPRQPVQIGELVVTPYQLDHTDPTWGFRLDYQGKVISYCVDTDASRASKEQMGEDLALYQGVDLLVFDSQYTIREESENVDWGHASATMGLDLAIREGIRKILFTHYSNEASDERIQEAAEQTKYYYDTIVKHAEREGKRVKRIEFEFVREGQVISVES